jgi:hypothetical protein
VYVREVEGIETTLGVSGALWRDSLVLYDRKTVTLWSQVNSAAIHGPLEGKQLKQIPSVLTTWAEWRKLHPDTLVLRPTADSREGSPYDGYFENPERFGIFGRENPDDRLPGKTLVLGVHSLKEAAAVPISALESHGIVEGRVGATPFVTMALPGGTGFAYDRRVDGQRLDFKRDAQGRFVDTRSGSSWDPETGIAVDGPMKGESLSRLRSLRVYWFIWAANNPTTAIFDS